MIPLISTSIGANIDLILSTLVAGSARESDFREVVATGQCYTRHGHGNQCGLLFANSSGQSWIGQTLTITNYMVGSDSLRFGTSSSGITTAQLALLRFADYGNVPGKIDANGFVTPDLPQPIITSPLVATGTVGQPFVYQFEASGATSLAVSNLLSGLSYNTQLAVITGIPTTEGTFQVGLSASKRRGDH